jgi:HAD superfamily hydrolase (TIGR01509 family)
LVINAIAASSNEKRFDSNNAQRTKASMIRAVIFDFNGVLVDDEPVHFALFREVLAEEGIALSLERYMEEYLGYDDRGCFEAALEAAGQPAGRARVDELIARKAWRYRSRAELGLKIFPGAADALKSTAVRWRVAICSGALRPEIEFALDRLKARGAVSAIVSAEDTSRCKPDPEGYLLTLRALRALSNAGLGELQAAECLVVEDSRAGIQSARAAGMSCVAVAHTYKPEELAQAEPDAILESLEMLGPTWIDQFVKTTGSKSDG